MFRTIWRFKKYFGKLLIRAFQNPLKIENHQKQLYPEVVARLKILSSAYRAFFISNLNKYR